MGSRTHPLTAGMRTLRQAAEGPREGLKISSRDRRRQPGAMVAPRDHPLVLCCFCLLNAAGDRGHGRTALGDRCGGRCACPPQPDGAGQSPGTAGKSCHSAEEFFALAGPAGGACILLDVSQPATELDLLGRLGPPESHLPVVGISNAASVATAVEAMKLGARDFLEASCPERRLGKALEDAFRWEAEHRRQIALVARVRRRRDSLNPGCRQVLDLLLAGRSNRQMAEDLDLSVRAVEERRAKVMRTMRAHSLAELVRLALLVEGGGPGYRQRLE